MDIQWIWTMCKTPPWANTPAAIEIRTFTFNCMPTAHCTNAYVRAYMRAHSRVSRIARSGYAVLHNSSDDVVWCSQRQSRGYFTQTGVSALSQTTATA